MTTKVHISRRGAIMMLFLVLLPVMVLFVGFAIDFAYVQKTRSELRRATDLAAKAAAVELSESGDTSIALQTAKDIAILNSVCGDGLTLEDGDVVFGKSMRQTDGSWTFTPGGAGPNAVQVLGRRTADSADGDVPSFFGSLYGRPTFAHQFVAVAAFVNVDICLVLDRSSSMKLPSSSTDPLMSGSDPRFCSTPWSDSRWVALENAVNIFLTELDGTSSAEHVGVVTFASNFTSCSISTPKISIDQTLTDSTSAVRAAISAKTSEHWNGMTDIEAGIVVGKDMLLGTGARTNALKFLVVLTDGQYTEDDPTVAAQAAADAGIVIYTITFSAGANQTDMQNIATIGNGRHYHADTPGELDSAFRDLGGTLANLVQ
ncbi:MAG: VWA domain-containing protein [Pirellulaceae bacterium]